MPSASPGADPVRDAVRAVTGRLADGWIPSLGFAPPDQIVGLRDQVWAAAESSGRSPSDITLAYHIQVQITAAADPDPKVVAGPSAYVIERLASFTELGFTALSLVAMGPDPAGQTAQLATEVVPALK